MSKEKTNPGNLSGFTDKEIDKMAEEAAQNGTLQAIDILGNTYHYDAKSEDMIRELVDMDGRENKDLQITYVLEMYKMLQGRILTVVDAVMEDKERAKYTKDLMKEAFRDISQTVYYSTLSK